jgi:membrane-associated phospholipid phosphatase
LGTATAAVSIAGDAVLVTLLGVRSVRASSTSAQIAVLGGTLIVEQAVAGAFKHAVKRDRPDRRHRPPVALHPSGPAFPSGHTSSGFYAATALAGRSSAVPLYGGASLVALSRLHQGVHAASDLIAGALLGAAGGSFARLLGRLPAVRR